MIIRFMGGSLNGRECEATDLFGENASVWMPDMMPMGTINGIPLIDPSGPEVYGRIQSDDPHIALYRLERTKA